MTCSSVERSTIVVARSLLHAPRDVIGDGGVAVVPPVDAATRSVVSGPSPVAVVGV
jgi:hypothetical protein